MSNFIVNPYRFEVGETDYEQLLGTSNSVQKNAVEGGVGIGINASDSQLVGTKPTKFSVYAYGAGSPTGDTYAVICDYRDDPPLDNVRATSNIVDASTFGSGTGNIGWIEYTFDGTEALQQYDTIAMIYTSGDGSNYIVTKMLSTAQPFETGKCFMNLWTESIWQGTAHGGGHAMDMRFKLTVKG